LYATLYLDSQLEKSMTATGAEIPKGTEIVENIPSNEELLATAEATRESFHAEMHAVVQVIPESEVRQMVESKGYTYTPIKTH
jgi:hypothetical protein